MEPKKGTQCSSPRLACGQSEGDRDTYSGPVPLDVIALGVGAASVS